MEYKMTREEYEAETRRIEERKAAIANGQVLEVVMYLTFEPDQPGDDRLRDVYSAYTAGMDVQSVLEHPGAWGRGLQFSTLKVEVAESRWGKFESGQYGEFVADAK